MNHFEFSGSEICVKVPQDTCRHIAFTQPQQKHHFLQGLILKGAFSFGRLKVTRPRLEKDLDKDYSPPKRAYAAFHVSQNKTRKEC